jgi:hypothetical protein
MGTRAAANAGEISATILVEQQTTPLSKTEELANRVDNEEVVPDFNVFN